MHTYISRIGANLHEAIGNRDADLIRSYRRALNSGIARAQEAANREADARGWDPVAVDGMLQEMEEETRASWEDRAVFYATQVTNLVGEAFETLNENRWSRRDCMEYQDELDWVMRTLQRICDELSLSDMTAKMRRAAWAQEDLVNHEYQRATRVVERLFFKLTGVGQRGAIRRPKTAVGTRENIETSSTTSTHPSGGWTTRTPFPWTGGPPCWWLTSLERTDRSVPGRACQELDGCAPLHPTGAEESVTSACRVYTSAQAFREVERQSS
jgi:hypothetical protein